MTINTVGHGTLPIEAFVGLARGGEIQEVVDIRSFPGSRRNPQFGRQEMQEWLPAAGLEYSWAEELGGRRRPVTGSKHMALRHRAFRAYADHMETPGFCEAANELLGLAGDKSIAVMCSESVWWRCHRRLLADHLVLVEGMAVAHLMHDGHRVAHPLTAGVRVAGGALVYDVGADPPPSTA